MRVLLRSAAEGFPVVGAGVDGAGPDGAGPDGAGPDGAGPDGAGPDGAELHEHYAANWLDTGGVRANFVAAVDGAVAVDGTSRGLQTPGDNAVFAALRDLADVVVAGAGTVLGEGYSPIAVPATRAAVRARFGLPAGLPIAVVSRTLRGLTPDLALFTDTAGTRTAARTIVLTCGSARKDRRAALIDVADVAVCGGDTVDPLAAVAALRARGFSSILCEGGPTEFARWVDAGVVDELCLSVSPLLAGPGPGRITNGAGWAGSHPLTLIGALEEGGALFLRYRVVATGR